MAGHRRATAPPLLRRPPGIARAATIEHPTRLARIPFSSLFLVFAAFQKRV